MSNPTELELLKKRADAMGIEYHPSIGLASLKQRVKAVMNDQPIPEEAPLPEVTREGQVVNTAKYVANESPIEMKKRLRREAHRMIRVNVTNRNPAMKDYTGDNYCVSNSIIGDIKKFVQYDTVEGYHVEHAIYEHLLEKEYQVFTETTDAKGRPMVTCKNVKELSVMVLDQLTPDEMDELKIKQALNKSID